MFAKSIRVFEAKGQVTGFAKAGFLSVILSAAPVVNADDIADLKKQLADVATKLQSYSGDGSDISIEVQSVRAALDKVEGQHRQNFLQDRSQQLETWLTDWKTNRYEPSWNVLKSLLAKLEDIERSDLLSAISRRSKGLKPLVENLEDYYADISILSITELGSLRDALSVLEQNLDPAVSARNRGLSLRDLLKQQLSGEQIGESTPTVIALTELKREIDRVTNKPGDLAVHIVQAKYGDTRAIEQASSGAPGPFKDPEDRYCDATDGAVQLCERKDGCPVSQANLNTICGYDPAPFADQRHKALKLTYRCFSGLDHEWSTLQQGRRFRQHPNNVDATLRGGQSIKCSPSP